MRDFSVLIGGKAGYGVDKSGTVIADMAGSLGFHVYVLRDYPSLIRGGHTYSLVRASHEKMGAHSGPIDLLLALNQDAIDLHRSRLSGNAVIVYDSDTVRPESLPGGIVSIGIPLVSIAAEEKAPEIMRNTCLVGAMCNVIGMSAKEMTDVINESFPHDADANLRLARRGFAAAHPVLQIERPSAKARPVYTGNEALSLGLIRGGLETYISYPMTPTSPILHFMAANAQKFGLAVMHPESEIAVMLMACGAAYAGSRVAVGSSGGGFCLMVEGLSFAGMAELPVVIVLGQRPGPSTGLPTYSTQTELGFALHAGQGEWTRLVVAPGDAEEAFAWARIALALSWKYQIPSLILTDKTLGEGAFSFEASLTGDAPAETPVLWDGSGDYHRYADTASGISPLAYPGRDDAVVKANSYEHDEAGLSTEDPAVTVKMQEKRLRKETHLAADLDRYEPVHVYGDQGSKEAIVCWGSNKWVCIEVARRTGAKVVQPVVMSPFPVARFKEALDGVERVIAVECNATGQLIRLVGEYGFTVDKTVLKYDGRPFSVEELSARIGSRTAD